MYCNKGKVNILSTIEKKEKVDDGYVHIYEYGKHFFHSTYECSGAAQDTTLSKMKYIFDIYNSEIEELRAINQYMQEHIDSCHKEPERCAAYLYQNTANFEDVQDITINIVHLTLGTGFHGKPYFFALLHKYPLFIGALERSDRAESGISRTFEKNKIW